MASMGRMKQAPKRQRLRDPPAPVGWMDGSTGSRQAGTLARNRDPPLAATACTSPGQHRPQAANPPSKTALGPMKHSAYALPSASSLAPPQRPSIGWRCYGRPLIGLQHGGGVRGPSRLHPRAPSFPLIHAARTKQRGMYLTEFIWSSSLELGMENLPPRARVRANARAARDSAGRMAPPTRGRLEQIHPTKGPRA